MPSQPPLPVFPSLMHGRKVSQTYHQRVAGDAGGAGLVLGGDGLLIGKALGELRGSSPFSGVSSIWAGTRCSGSMPTWLSRARRRGEAEARMSSGRLAIRWVLLQLRSALRKAKGLRYCSAPRKARRVRHSNRSTGLI